MSESTTDLLKLPYSQNNVNYNVTEQTPQYSSPPHQLQIPSIHSQQSHPQPPPSSQQPVQDMSPQMQQDEVKKMLNDLENASNKGLTNIPSRDIDRNSNSITSDTEILPNYLPSNNDESMYDIENDKTVNEVIESDDKKQNFDNLFDYYFDEFNSTFIVCVLFFILQLPITSKTIKQILPILYAEDGNIKLQGILFKCIIFTILYYCIKKFVN